MTPKRFMLIAGEPSGDILAAELVHELRSAIAVPSTYTSNLQPLRSDLAPEFFGAGGPKMAEAGVKLEVEMTRHSVVGLSDWVKNYLKFKKIFDCLVALALEKEPHCIICVDFSDFNQRFMAAIKKHTSARCGPFKNWQPKLVKYISPQVWASRPDRAYQMAHDLDLLLAIFPFEKEWYARKVPQLKVEFVGHPMIGRYAKEEMTAGRADIPLPAVASGGAIRTSRPALNSGSSRREEALISSPSNPLVLLLPGSRRSELNRHLPVLLGAWKMLQSSLPQASAKLILPNQQLAELAHAIMKTESSAPVEIQIGDLPKAMTQASLALASTGTVTMECAYFGVPAVTLYKASWWEFEIGKRLITVKWLTMPNILADEEIFPEFLQNAATAENIYHAALNLLKDTKRRDQLKEKLKAIVATLGDAHAAKRAASAILRLV
jgi:lipid-A-disaccharide synthase